MSNLDNGGIVDGRWAIEPGGPIAVEHWPARGDACWNHGRHYHCTRCGAVTSMYGHALGGGGFSCEASTGTAE